MKPISTLAEGVAPSATLAVDSLAKQMKADGKPVIGFGTGEPDFDTPQNIKDAAVAAIAAGKTKYTAASGIAELKKAVCARLREDCGPGYAPAEIVIASGAKHSFYAALRALLNPGDEAVIPAPYWVTYPEAVKMCGAVPVIVAADESAGFKITAAQLEAAVTPKTKLFIINNPSNPTGMLYSEAELRALADVCVRHDLYIVADEIYYKLVYSGKFTSIASLGADIKERTVLINGVSKSYAMTGWRIGYSASSASLARVMENYLSHSTSAPSTVSQWAAVEALAGDQTSVEAMRLEFVRRREYIVRRVNEIPDLSCITPDGAFYVMINVSRLFGRTTGGAAIANADDFALALLERKLVALVSCESFGAPGFVRMTYAAGMDDIAEGLDRIAEFVAGDAQG
ncbi:MAG: pyridoxal phosphate-dependent aminotransferase [Oscillospiraceae bacterium]|jgi:aspartate aminotransferase|nr:pyridoxal phosphate-dependent aminotransferase [Oscillospiraceae bacterium]